MQKHTYNIHLISILILLLFSCSSNVSDTIRPDESDKLENNKVRVSVDQQKNKMGNEFIQLAGEDANAFEFNKKGGVGCISVTANVAPKLCSNMQKLSKSNIDKDLKEAERIDALLPPLHKSLFIESNPSPIKFAAKLLGLCDESVRLPLVTIMDNTKNEVKKSLIAAKLINE